MTHPLDRRAWAAALAVAGCIGLAALPVQSLASEPTVASDAGAAVAGGGKSSYWSRNDTKLTLPGVALAPPAWQAEVNASDSQLAFSAEEQQELVEHLRAALAALVQLPVAPGPAPADPAAPSSLAERLEMTARITQASMPNIARNVLVLALPIPIPGVRSLFRSRGGASIEVYLLSPGVAEPVARFACDHQVGLISLLDSYRRLAQAKTAMDRCVSTLAASVPQGRLVTDARPLNTP